MNNSQWQRAFFLNIKRFNFRLIEHWNELKHSKNYNQHIYRTMKFNNLQSVNLQCITMALFDYIRHILFIGSIIMKRVLFVDLLSNILYENISTYHSYRFFELVF